MKTKHIVSNIAIIFTLGVAASANAQLLGGGGALGGSLGGSLGGMTRGMGSIGGQAQGMGSIASRGSLINEMRSSRSLDAAGNGVPRAAPAAMVVATTVLATPWAAPVQPT